MIGNKRIARLALLGAALAGWAALAWAQNTVTTLPATQPGEGTTTTSQPAQPVEPAKPVAVAQVQPEAQPVVGGMEESDLVNGPTEGNTTGRQEPAVSIEWIGPAVAKVGRPADYTVAVRNACNIAVQRVMVQVRIPNGVSVVTTEPKAAQDGNILTWQLDTLATKQEKNLQVRLIAESKGNVNAQAWVTFTGVSSTRIRVCEPKLVLKATAPEKVMVGDAATFVLTVSNPGDGPADQVRISADLSEGLEHLRGKKVDFDIGSLGPNETRSVQLICATKAGGVQTCHAVATADGEMRSEADASVNVIAPRLELEATGPKLRYLDRKGTYSFKVTNPGDASATNVTVSDVVPAGFKFVSATDGGRHDFSTRTVTWFLGELGPGQAKEVKVDVLAINVGEHHHKATAQAARGIKDEKEVITKVEGLSAILLEVVDTEDPIEVGAETSYEIRITNTGSKTENDLKLACTVPPQMQFKGAQGPTRYNDVGGEVIFEPLPKLAPRADAIYRVTVKCLQPGDVRFTTKITSQLLQEPVIEMEATRIYSD